MSAEEAAAAAAAAEKAVQSTLYPPHFQQGTRVVFPMFYSIAKRSRRFHVCFLLLLMLLLACRCEDRTWQWRDQTCRGSNGSRFRAKYHVEQGFEAGHERSY